MKISMNGAICDEKEAVVSVYDHGFLYGLGLFETFRTYGGKPFLLPEHLSRLKEGCAELRIDFEPDERRIREMLSLLLEENDLHDAYFRYSVSAGVDLLGLPAANYQHPFEIIYIKTLPPRDHSAYEIGKPLQRLKLTRNTPEGSSRLKSFHYMNNILAKRELQTYAWAAGSEGLMLSKEGFIAEGIVSNVFFVKNQAIFTPALEIGILPGITRSFILILAERNQLTVKEGYYNWDKLLAADEIFYVNSIQEIVPVTRLFSPEGQHHQVGQGIPGDITRSLMRLYDESTGSGL
jgi:4-amino-4-deoxychorismate lyase